MSYNVQGYLAIQTLHCGLLHRIEPYILHLSINFPTDTDLLFLSKFII